jgi:hypothetical protein
MKNPKSSLIIFSALLAVAISGRGQTVFQVSFRGTSETTNADSGAIVSRPINNQSLVRDAMAATGIISNAAPLTVAYVQNASSDPGAPGDFIEVINKTNGATVYTNLQFMYGAGFGTVLTNADGSRLVTSAEVFPLPLASGNSLGTATINVHNTAKRTSIMGSFNYTVLLTPTNTPTVNVISGTFNVGKQIAVP